MKVIKIQISHRTKPMWAIELAPKGNGGQAVMYGAYRDNAGFVRFSAWNKRKEAKAHLEFLQAQRVGA